MSADANWTYTYDVKGNLTEKDSTATGSLLHWIYVYNDANEMTEARQYDASGMLSQTVDYKYGVFGNLIQEAVTVSSTTTTRFAYDGSNIVASLDGSSSLTSRYVYADGVAQPIVR